MPPLDIKKIITSFLVLSVAAGTVAFIFSTFSLPSAPQKQNITAQASAPDAQPEGNSSLPAESLPPDTFSNLAPTPTTPLAATSTNLTDQIADSLAGEIMQANPNGPQAGSDGKSEITVPDNLQDIIAAQLTEKSLGFVSVPLEENRIRIQKNYNSQDIENYFASIKDIVENTYVKDGIAKLARSTDTMGSDTVAAASLAISEAEDKLYNLTAPAPLEKLHRAVLSYVAYQKNVFDPALDSDPMRSLVLAQNYEAEAQIRSQDIKDAMNDLVKNPPLIQNKQTGFLQKIILPKTAYAQFGIPAIVFDVPTEINTFGQWMKVLANFLYHQALVVLKQQIIHRMVMQTINWIQGNGTPQFISNWGSFLDQTATNAANVAISSLNDITHGQLCSSFGPLITIQLRQQYLNEIRPTCTLDRVISNVDNFYNSFENGGWIAYGTLTSPSGNYYGSMLQAQISVQNKINAAQANANSKAQANKGFLGTDQCVQWVDDPIDQAGQSCINAWNAYNASKKVGIDVGQPPCTLPQQTQSCARYETVTPGGAVANSLDVALTNSGFDNIISADDIGALVDAMINSALQKLIKFSTTGVTGLLKGDQNTPSNVSANQNIDPCVGLTGGEYNQCKGITGASASTTQSGTDISTDQQSLLAAVKTDLSTLGDTLDADNAWLSLATGVQSSANQLKNSCPAQSSVASSLNSSLANMKVIIQNEADSITRTNDEICTNLNTLHSWQAKFQCLQGDLLSAKTVDDISQASKDLDQYTQQTQDLMNHTAATRVTNLQNVNTALQANLLAPPASCESEPIPAL